MERPTPIAVRSIIILNILVYILWNVPGQGEPTFMIQHFLVSWTALTEGRFWTLLTSEFSHNMFLHIFINMYVFYGFGSIMEMALGISSFLKFYLVAAIISSLSHSLACAFLLHQPDLPALGASGAISGVVVLFSLLFPRQRILLLGIIPVPALIGAMVAVGLDLWGLIAQTQGGSLPIGFGAHLGGSLTGVLYYFLFIRRKKYRSAF